MSEIEQAIEVSEPQAGHGQPAAESDAGFRQVTGRSSNVFGGRRRMDPASPASVAARIKRHPAALPLTAATNTGSAPMGGRTPAKDLWGDGMINEADRGGAHDY
jgi:hypothetical protein